jgi:hypothetical protein
MLTTHAASAAAARVSWQAIQRARWVAIEIEGMDARSARRVNDVLVCVPGVITVQAERGGDGVVITFDPAVTAPGALADVVALVSAHADRSVPGTVTAMRTGPLAPLNLMDP